MQPWLRKTSLMAMALLFLVGMPLGCALLRPGTEPASASVASQRLEPDAEIKLPRVMVQVPIEDLETRHLTELAFENLALKARLETQFVPSHMLFFPGRTYTDEEITNTLHASEISAVLKISVSGVGSTPTYIPRRTFTSTSGSATTTLGAAGLNTRGSGISLTTETGGYYAQAPFANFRLELFDLKTDRVVWIATARTKGEVGVDRSELVLSLARNTLLRL